MKKMISTTEEQRIRRYSRYVAHAYGRDESVVEAETRQDMLNGRAKRLTDAYHEVSVRLGLAG